MNIIELAKQAGLGESYISKTRKESGIVIKNIDCLEAFANLVEAAARADEREACAKLAETTVCDIHLPTGTKIYGSRVATAIRARGTT